ncbi:hypothetical protein Y1Q_0017452 [Alligator mississippiensis]|uniref:Uncharacterized protein n=1 Tax=Alligator mississippiensis TaxID=8496 RepID=A0A151P211_ALLMI|nr:hypothetical protein Y1Q_0017452 [Alligator mississippiensis]
MLGGCAMRPRAAPTAVTVTGKLLAVQKAHACLDSRLERRELVQTIRLLLQSQGHSSSMEQLLWNRGFQDTLLLALGKIYFTRKKDAQTREVPMSFCKLLKAFDTLDNNCWIKTWQNIYILLKAIAESLPIKSHRKQYQRKTMSQDY